MRNVEFEVSNDVLREYNMIKNYIKKVRSQYFLDISKQLRHNYDVAQINEEFVKKLLLKRVEHENLTKKIRLVLELSESQRKNITFSDKNFDKSKFI